MSRAEEAKLVERIRRGTGATRVELGERMQSLWAGYGELRRVRLEGTAVSHAVVKNVAPPSERELARDAAKLRSHRRKRRSYEVELAFYRGLARGCPAQCRVPRLLFGEASEGRVLFVLEDLDEAGFPARRPRCSEPAIGACLRWLAGFHAWFLGQEPEHLWRVGSYWQLATRPDELAALVAHPLRRAAAGIDERLNAARYRSLVHGDAKLENFCFSEAGTEVAAVDFQYVGGGVGVKDVAYFLGSVLQPGECAAAIPGCLELYFAALREALAPRAADFDIAAVEREWRELFPWAWLDFYRFLLGWAPHYAASDRYGERLQHELLESTETSSSGLPGIRSQGFGKI